MDDERENQALQAWRLGIEYPDRAALWIQIEGKKEILSLPSQQLFAGQMLVKKSLSYNGLEATQKVIRNLALRAARRANLANGGVHILRHTFCSHLAMKGAPARAIQELAEHRNLSTTQRYMHCSPAAVEAAIQLLELSSPAQNFGDGHP